MFTLEPKKKQISEISLILEPFEIRIKVKMENRFFEKTFSFSIRVIFYSFDFIKSFIFSFI